MKARRRPRRKSSAPHQRGQAFLLAVLLLAIGIGALVYNLASPAKVEIEKDRITAAALAQAKAALIGYAAGVSDLAGGDRPGDLPCPDLNDSGAPLSPSNVNCNTQATRIGRLPWKHLGLPDLRDGDGERLWYAVSDNFKNNVRTACATPGVAGCVNSDARGTITVRNSDGTVVNNGNDAYGSFNPSGVIAVIFAPGAVLQRQDTGILQDRSCAGGTCTAAGVCNEPVASVAKCNPVNYLDVQTGVEDNAAFTDGSATDGFINGVIRDAGGNVIVNDRVITITYADLMPALQKRVAREVTSCLNQYAAVSQNRGRYPWAAPITDTTSPYADQVDYRFGRIADTLSATLFGVGGWPATTICTVTGNLSLCMTSTWPTGCGITQGSWWMNWKEQVFYGVATAYQPASPTDNWWGWGAVPTPGGCGSCLTVDPPSPTANKRYVVVVAGRRLSAVAGGQPRVSAANKSFPGNFLEDANGDPTGPPYEAQNIYTDQAATTTYNDVILYQ